MASEQILIPPYIKINKNKRKEKLENILAGVIGFATTFSIELNRWGQIVDKIVDTSKNYGIMVYNVDKNPFNTTIYYYGFDPVKVGAYQNPDGSWGFSEKLDMSNIIGTESLPSLGLSAGCFIPNKKIYNFSLGSLIGELTKLIMIMSINYKEDNITDKLYNFAFLDKEIAGTSALSLVPMFIGMGVCGYKIGRSIYEYRRPLTIEGYKKLEELMNKKLKN